MVGPGRVQVATKLSSLSAARLLPPGGGLNKKLPRLASVVRSRDRGELRADGGGHWPGAWDITRPLAGPKLTLPVHLTVSTISQDFIRL